MAMSAPASVSMTSPSLPSTPLVSLSFLRQQQLLPKRRTAQYPIPPQALPGGIRPKSFVLAGARKEGNGSPPFLL